MDYELAGGPLGQVIVQHLAPEDRARLALTCRAGRAAALAPPVDCQLAVETYQLASFNAWLCRLVAAGAGRVRDVRLLRRAPPEGLPDPHARAVATACHLARCGTEALALYDPCPAILEAACTIGSLTRLWLTVDETLCPLDPLRALPALRSLSLNFRPFPWADGVGALMVEPWAWRPALPTLEQLALLQPPPCTLRLDGCCALQQVHVYEGDGLALTASAAQPQLTRLKLCCPRGAAVAWEHLLGLKELELQLDDEAGAGLLEDITHLEALSSLHAGGSAGAVLPPGSWLAGAARLVLDDFADWQDPAHLGWAASATGVEDLILWLKHGHLIPYPPAQAADKIAKWVLWAGGRPRLRRAELRVGTGRLDNTDVLCQAARAEGEGVGSMLLRLLWDVAEALLRMHD